MQTNRDNSYSVFVVFVGTIMFVSVLGMSLFDVNVPRACTPDNSTLNPWEFISFVGYNLMLLLTGYHIKKLNKL